MVLDFNEHHSQHGHVHILAPCKRHALGDIRSRQITRADSLGADWWWSSVHSDEEILDRRSHHSILLDLLLHQIRFFPFRSQYHCVTACSGTQASTISSSSNFRNQQILSRTSFDIYRETSLNPSSSSTHHSWIRAHINITKLCAYHSSINYRLQLERMWINIWTLFWLLRDTLRKEHRGKSDVPWKWSIALYTPILYSKYAWNINSPCHSKISFLIWKNSVLCCRRHTIPLFWSNHLCFQSSDPSLIVPLQGIRSWLYSRGWKWLMLQFRFETYFGSFLF